MTKNEIVTTCHLEIGIIINIQTHLNTLIGVILMPFVISMNVDFSFKK